ncbi:MAG: hypothetical protein ACI8PZ_005430 [Myxococcota bacterium]|jgi:uncharacterized protein (DUF885 family)
MRLGSVAVVLAGLWCVACARVGPTASGPAPLEHGAAAGVSDPSLAALLAEHWDATLEAAPVWATSLGDHRFDDRVAGTGPEVRAEWASRSRDWRARATALDALSASDALTRDLLLAELQADAEVDVCRFSEWSFSARSNPLGDANYLSEVHPLRHPSDGDALVARYRQLPGMIELQIADLESGLAAGLVTNRATAERVVEMFDRQLALPVEDWPLLRPATADLDWPGAPAERFQAELAEVAERQVIPALRRYREFVADRVVPAARPQGQDGLGGLALGDACYAALARQHTTLPLTPAEVHAIGLAEMARIHDEFRVLGPSTLGTDDLQVLFARMRTEPSLYFDSEEAVQASASDALARATAAMPQWFGRLPAATCTVERVPDYEAPYTTIAYYRPGSADGSRPGAYFVNTFAPETRPRHEAEVLAFHEAIPGHHLQIAIAQELDAVPAFRRHGGKTAFVEGWALYSERLADEMGLYSGDSDRLGVLSFDAWRAARLVVDTGVHAKGWSRADAERYLMENTPLAENNISNEVDRYIAWPGQALGYKIGQLDVWALRHEAEAALGDRFEIRAFHDVVLGAGPVTLPILRTRVRDWIVEQR